MMPMPDFLIFSYITIFVNSVFLCAVGILAYRTRNDRKTVEYLWSNKPTVNWDVPRPATAGEEKRGETRIAPKYIDDATAARLEREQILNNREKGR